MAEWEWNGGETLMHLEAAGPETRIETWPDRPHEVKNVRTYTAHCKKHGEVTFAPVDEPTAERIVLRHLDEHLADIHNEMRKFHR